MPDPVVVQVLDEYRAGLAEREAQQFRTLTRGWVAIEDELETQIIALAEALETQRLTSRSAIEQLSEYRRLRARAQQLIEQFSHLAEESISDEQAAYAELGLEAGAQATRAAYISAGAAIETFPTLSAIETAIGFAGDGTPLRALIAAAFPASTDGILRVLISAVALGWNPRKTAALMRERFRTPLAWALRLARTEQLRDYREATRAQFRESGVVRGYRRLAAKSLRTCLACLIADGRYYDLDTPLDEHPNGRCSLEPVLIGVEPPDRQTGREYFLGLSAADQKTIMGLERYALWKQTDFSLERVIKPHTHPVWGDSLQVRAARELAPR